MKSAHLRKKEAQSSLESLLLVGGAVLVATIVLTIIISSTSQGDGLLGSTLDEYTDSLDDAAFGDDEESNPQPSVCPNGITETGETCDSDTIACTIGGYAGTQTCLADCSGYDGCVTTLFCGDFVCNGTETTLSCPADCGGSGPVCPDGVCDAGETSLTCPQDCGAPAFCGNATCDVGEDLFTCAEDCPVSFSPQELWMHPNHYVVHSGTQWVEGPAGWDTTVNSIDVFGVFGVGVQGTDNFSLPYIDSQGIRVNVEIGGLRPGACDGGWYFANVDRPIYDELVAGGHDNFIASVDAPFTYTVLDGFYSQCDQAYQDFAGGSGPDPATLGCIPQPPACNLTIDQVSDEMVEYLDLFHKRYPNADIGWIEPHPLFNYDTYTAPGTPIAGTPFPDFKQIIDVFTAKISTHNATNPPADPDITLRFYHADASYSTASLNNLWNKQKAIATHVRSKGMRFGILLNEYDTLPPSAPQAAKDQAFAVGTLHYYDCWHEKGGTLDDVVVESWVGTYPLATHPEETLNTFTNVMYRIIERMVDPSKMEACPV